MSSDMRTRSRQRRMPGWNPSCASRGNGVAPTRSFNSHTEDKVLNPVREAGHWATTLGTFLIMHAFQLY